MAYEGDTDEKFDRIIDQNERMIAQLDAIVFLLELLTSQEPGDILEGD